MLKNRKRGTKEKRRFSLRYKWILFICSTVLLALVSTTVFTHVTISGILKDDDKAENKRNADHVALQVEAELEGYERSLEQLAALIESQLERKDAISRIEASIYAVQQNNPLIISAYYMDGKNGKLHISPQTEFSGDARETRTYTELKENPDTQWMDVYGDIVDGTIMTSVVAPVMLNGKMVGALGYDIDLSTIGKTRENIEKGSVNKLAILDAQGVVVTSFMKDANGKNMNPGNNEKKEGVEDFVSNQQQFKSQFKWIEEIYQGQSNHNTFTWDEKPYNIYSTTIPDLNWKVISFNPQHVLLSKMKDVMQTSLISIVIGLFIGALCARFLAGKLTKMIINFQQVLGKTENGDLATEFIVTSNDELGDLSASYNRMLHNMRRLISKVDENVSSVHEASTGLHQVANENSIAIAEVSRSIEDIAAGAANQSEELEDGTTAIQELDNDIETLIKQSNTNQQVVDEAASHLEAGTMQVSNLDNSYQNLENAFLKVTDMVSSLDEKSKSISDVTGAISQIAEQTNLLSLNASIEAARAGEHGKGFAVVANEVRSLAEESKTAADNIQEIINMVLQDTTELVKVMKETNQISQEQKNAVSAVSLSITDLAISLNNMLMSISEEAKSINSIQGQKDIVIKMIEGITAVSQQTSASSEEISASMEEQSASSNEVAQYTVRLASLVEELEKTVAEFHIQE